MDYPVVAPQPGLKRRVVSVGESVMQVIVQFEPGVVTATHSHPHEQLVYVLEGEVVFEIDGKRETLRAGDARAIAGGVRHGAWTEASAAKVLDTFRPIREDFL
jgi:quercetin dioxygenase-like cupin family protein